MSAVVQPGGKRPEGRVRLFADEDLSRIVAWHGGHAVSAGDFLRDVANARVQLRRQGSVINLCEDRYAFSVGFCAAVCQGQTTLLPSSRAPQAISEVQALHPGSFIVGDGESVHACDETIRLLERSGTTELIESGDFCVDAELIAAMGFTSGSTGQPKPNAKTWNGLRNSSALNIQVLTTAMGLPAGASVHVVATVPAQHMYGMEMSVLLPLFGRFAVHSGRPFFPADIARALAEIPEPRLLVTTPVHLQALLSHGIELPPIAAVVSATAPLPQATAAEAEQRLSTQVLELFGSTETCVIAYRRTAIEVDWSMHEGVSLQPQPDGTLVHTGYLPAPVLMHDILEPLPDRRFRLHGRNGDLLEIAGKRASLADLTRRLQALKALSTPSSSSTRRVQVPAFSVSLRWWSLRVAPKRIFWPSCVAPSIRCSCHDRCVSLTPCRAMKRASCLARQSSMHSENPLNINSLSHKKNCPEGQGEPSGRGSKTGLGRDRSPGNPSREVGGFRGAVACTRLIRREWAPISFVVRKKSCIRLSDIHLSTTEWHLSALRPNSCQRRYRLPEARGAVRRQPCVRAHRRECRPRNLHVPQRPVRHAPA